MHIFVLAAALFGPYVLPSVGIAAYHVVIYGYGLYWLLSRRLLIQRRLFWPLLLLLATICSILLSTQFNGRPVALTSFLAEFDGLLLIVGIILAIDVIVQGLDRQALQNLLDTWAKLICLFLVSNSLLAVSMIFSEDLHLFRLFIGVDKVESGVWHASNVLGGRFTGMFIQPIDAGIAYSLGLLSLIYLRARNAVSLVTFIGTAALLIVGGALSISKAFLVLGVGLAALFFLMLGREAIKTSLVAIVPATLLAVPTLMVFEHWSGANFFLRFFNPASYSNGIIFELTGHRFGGKGSGAEQLLVDELTNVALIGKGFGQSVVFDNALYAFLFWGGLPALLFYLAFLGLLGLYWLTNRYYHHATTWLFIFVFLLFVGADMGGPVLVLNRTGPIVLGTLMLCLLVISIGDNLKADARER